MDEYRGGGAANWITANEKKNSPHDTFSDSTAICFCADNAHTKWFTSLWWRGVSANDVDEQT